LKGQGETYLKRTPLKRKTPLRAKTPLKAKTALRRTSRLNKVSVKHNVESKEWQATTGELISQIGYCEICGGTWCLQGHHIIWRSRWTEGLARQYGLDNADKNTRKNCLIICLLCHSHDKYPESGLPISIVEALQIAYNRNKRLDGIN
jgi:hypothetical protein